ncbi:MAG: cell division protein FtsA [Bacteroidetes bacterium]|jgi:cell division protein FtsA|nr:cell division protein FtsA [Bacteroidota bacterium]
MDNSKIIVGLDIGTTKICVIVGLRNENGKVDVLGIGQSPSDGVMRGMVANVDRTVESIKTAVQMASRVSDVEITHVHVGIAGQHIKSHHHRGSIVRRNYETEITDEDVKRLFDDIQKVATGPGQKILHIIPQEYTVDNEHGIKHPVGHSGVKIEGNFHIITGQVTAAQTIHRCVEKAGLQVVGITLEPLASAAAVLSEEEKEAGVALVDIGGGTTDLAIFQDHFIRHTAVIPLGGNIITEDIKQGCSLMTKQAEALKTNFGSALAEQVDLGEIITIPGISGREPKDILRRNLAHIIQARVEEIFEHVLFEIKSSGYADRLLGGIVLTGGGAMLKDIIHLVELVTGINTRIGTPGVHLGHGLTEKVNDPMYATGVGLVVNALDNNLNTGDNKQSNADTKTRNQKSKIGGQFVDMFKNWFKDDLEDFK